MQVHIRLTHHCGKKRTKVTGFLCNHSIILLYIAQQYASRCKVRIAVYAYKALQRSQKEICGDKLRGQGVHTLPLKPMRRKYLQEKGWRGIACQKKDTTTTKKQYNSSWKAWRVAGAHRDPIPFVAWYNRSLETVNIKYRGRPKTLDESLSLQEDWQGKKEAITSCEGITTNLNGRSTRKYAQRQKEGNDTQISRQISRWWAFFKAEEENQNMCPLLQGRYASNKARGGKFPKYLLCIGFWN